MMLNSECKMAQMVYGYVVGRNQARAAFPSFLLSTSIHAYLAVPFASFSVLLASAQYPLESFAPRL
jgi:hypothetical protein